MQVESLKKLDYLYQQLEHRITSGEWPVGSRIPTESELAAEYECSRGTVSKAIARLTHEGVVVRKTRAGTTVVRNTFDHRGNSLDLNACAFVYPSDQHEGIWRIAHGFQQLAHQTGRRSMMLTTGLEFRKEADVLNRLAEMSVKGAVVYTVISNPQEQVDYSRVIQDCPIPIVLVELNLHGTGRPAVVADGLHAGYTVTRHLLDKGLKRVGFLSNYAWVPYVRDRFLGYRQAMDEAGIGCDPKIVSQIPSMTPSFDDPFHEPTHLALDYLREHPGIEALVCATDFLAHGSVRAAKQLGISVPDQLKIVGMDDLRTLSPDTLPVTTYHIPYEEMGQTAFAKLEECLHTGRCEPTEQQLRGKLVVRASSGG